MHHIHASRRPVGSRPTRSCSRPPRTQATWARASPIAGCERTEELCRHRAIAIARPRWHGVRCERVAAGTRRQTRVTSKANWATVAAVSVLALSACAGDDAVVDASSTTRASITTTQLLMTTTESPAPSTTIPPSTTVAPSTTSQALDPSEIAWFAEAIEEAEAIGWTPQTFAEQMLLALSGEVPSNIPAENVDHARALLRAVGTAYAIAAAEEMGSAP